MRALAVVLVAPFFVACAADPPPPAAPPVASPSRTEDDAAKVTAEVCRSWATTFVSRVREANERRIQQCTKELTAAGADTTSLAKLDEKDLAASHAEAQRLHDLIVDQCGQQTGAAFVRSDSECFTKAPKLEDWPQCRFKSAFFSEYAAVSKNHQRLFDQRCAELKKGPDGNKPATTGS
jgi:hypothetical protein